MNLVCSSIFIITAIIVAIYDFKYQQIPIALIIVNYLLLSYISIPNIIYKLIVMVIGIGLLLYYKKQDLPIDRLFFVFISYLILIHHNNIILSVIEVLILLLYVVLSKKEKISLMVPIEIICIIEIILKEDIIQWLVQF